MKKYVALVLCLIIFAGCSSGGEGGTATANADVLTQAAASENTQTAAQTGESAEAQTEAGAQSSAQTEAATEANAQTSAQTEAATEANAQTEQETDIPSSGEEEIAEEEQIDLDSIYSILALSDHNTPEGFDKKNDETTYGELTEVEYYSNTTEANRKCYVFTPPGYDPEITYPVLYLLHGIGGIHSEWLGGNPDVVLSNLIASGEAKPMVVVIPNVRAMKDDGYPKEVFGQENIAAFGNFINDLRNDLMPFISENYSVSDKRSETAIAGLSMGGKESLFIGVSMPETFGYVGAFSPAPGLLAVPEMNFPGQVTAEEMTFTDKYNDNTFMLIINGNQDGVVGDIPLTYHEAFDANNVRHAYYTIDGGHDFTVWKNGLYYFAKSIF
ncbi:MAG: esterase family protein [Clostridiales bacterium]|jgi:enterochelin esterase-like enzyme|nr:esterase family protein [Clostridiales bacterium]